MRTAKTKTPRSKPFLFIDFLLLSLMKKSKYFYYKMRKNSTSKLASEERFSL